MKYGFTLAEVLVTLGIIGVVAALTTPALIQNVGNAKIPPRLAKAKSTFENATQMMLVEESSNSILGITADSEELGKELSKYMKINKCDRYPVFHYNGSSADEKMNELVPFCSDDGMTYWIDNSGSKAIPQLDRNIPNIPHNQSIGYIWIDINGKEGPNKRAKDIFYFNMFNDGSIQPFGSLAAGSSFAQGHETIQSWHWSHHRGCSENGVTMDYLCAGFIFESGMKIIYE